MRSKFKAAWAAVFLIHSSAGFLSAQGYETLYALTDQKSGLLTESDFRSVMGSLQSTFKSFSSYMFDGGRRNAGDSVFSWDSYDNPSPYDVYGVVALYEKISVRWGNEIIHWKWPNMLRESDPAYAGYLRDLQEPYHKLGAHAKALAGAYENAAKRLKPAGFKDKSNQELLSYMDRGFMWDYAEAVRVLLDRGEIEKVRDRLKGSEADVRYRTSWSIAVISLQGSYPGHESALGKDSLSKLAQIASKEFAEDMISLLDDKDEHVRFEAAYYMAHTLERPGYEDKMAKLLKDSNSYTRQAVLFYLGDMKAVKHRQRVEALLKDPDEEVKKEAQEAMRKISKEQVRRLLEKGEKEAVGKKLKDADANERYFAALALWDLESKGFEKDMSVLLSDKDAEVRCQAFGYLTHLYGQPGYEEKVAKGLSDSRSCVRREAAEYLGWTKAAQYKSRIETLLNDSDEDVKKAAKEALKKMK